VTINEVVFYIDEHLTDDLRLVDIAKLAGYSPWHLYELFKILTGKPIMSYIRERKIRCASQETVSGRRLYDIAMDYGFETQAGFYKAFNSVIGCPPSEYKSHELRGVHRQNTELINNINMGVDFMENVIIREVRQTDAKDLWENIFSRNTPQEVEERIAGNLVKMKSGDYIHFVAEVDGVVIGNMSFNKETHPLYAHKCFLGDVVVNPAFQRMGIAKKLFESCKKQAVQQGLKLITVTTRGGTDVEEVYKKLGFIEAGRIPNGIIETWGDKNLFDEVFFYIEL
jgi:AraC-like DNA-binding protein/predicted N-acetyltransferase YhbS